jgi:hypothetical protein
VNNRILKSLFAVATVATLGSVAVPASAWTYTFPASGGRTDLAANANCFDAPGGVVTQNNSAPNCSANLWWTMPVHYTQTTPAASFSSSVSGFVPAGGFLYCASQGVSWDGLSFFGNPGASWSVPSPHTVKAIASPSDGPWGHISIPPRDNNLNGYAYVACLMGPGASIASVTFSD